MGSYKGKTEGVSNDKNDNCISTITPRMLLKVDEKSQSNLWDTVEEGGDGAV